MTWHSTPTTFAAFVRELESAFGSLNVLVVQSEAPANNGETLFVRFAVWLLDLDRVPEKWPNRWKLLEMLPSAKCIQTRIARFCRIVLQFSGETRFC